MERQPTHAVSDPESLPSSISEWLCYLHAREMEAVEDELLAGGRSRLSIMTSKPNSPHPCWDTAWEGLNRRTERGPHGSYTIM